MSPQAPAPAIVGLKTWLWLDKGSWSVRRAKAKAGDVTVTAEARPLSVIWDLGEKRIVCHSPGRVWEKNLPREASTPCGYTFRHTSTHQPNDRYRVRVFVNYGVSWRCEGDCDEADGDLGTLASPTAQLDLRVTERQSVVVR
ncbi:hypothetical protein ASD11_14670 [Aeromicrobium sp. Root495]|nr:hypothetical protein ASD11_14670 [Aeromicrobium sp. Root495]